MHNVQKGVGMLMTKVPDVTSGPMTQKQHAEYWAWRNKKEHLKLNLGTGGEIRMRHVKLIHKLRNYYGNI